MLENVGQGKPNMLWVLTYHRVDEPDRRPMLYPGLLSASPQDFDQQLNYLAATCHMVSSAELLDVCFRGYSLPARSVMVTFDDAYCDFKEYAWPILKSYKIPATLFVPTAFPDHPERPFWWDQLYCTIRNCDNRDHINTPIGSLRIITEDQRYHAFNRLKNYIKSIPHSVAMELVDQLSQELGKPHVENSVLTWEDLRSLAEEGVTLCPHTRTHPMLDRIPISEAETEILGSLQDLEREIGSAEPLFAYPSGGFDPGVLDLLKRRGFALAFTTIPGVNDLGNVNWHRLRRINVSRNAPFSVFRARLLPWSAYVYDFSH
jgi:peptidoglycan/xylan/chitin deacetylase (PgdA/CDA1 family)